MNVLVSGSSVYKVTFGSFLWLIIPIIVIGFTIRYFYLRYTKNGKRFVKDKQNTVKIKNRLPLLDIDSDNTKELVDRLLKLSNSNNNYTNLINSISSQKTDNIQTSDVDKISDKTMMCKFSLCSLMLLSVSDSFLTFNNVNSFDELVCKYSKRNNIRKLKGMPLNTNDIIDIESKQNCSIVLQDVFEIDKMLFDQIIKMIQTNTTTSKFQNIRLKLSVDILSISIYTLCDFIIDGDCLIVEFKIEKILPKISATTDNIDITNYKSAIRNISIDIEYPILIVDDSGITFMNKCTCDWFNIPYNEINTIQNSEMTVSTFDDIFSIIDDSLPSLIRSTLNDSNSIGFYLECIIKESSKTVGSLTLSNVPSEVIVHAIPFTSDNQRKLIITIQNTVAMHEYMNKNNKSKLYDTDTSNFISKIMSLNEGFKGFFCNTHMVSFGRIDVNTKNILLCNDSFEELITYDSQKDRYRSIINNIISNYKTNIESEVNFYFYTINYSDKETNVIYSYDSNIVDIVFIDRHNRSFLSNNSMDLLNDFYQTSDLPIVIVDKTAHILKCNKCFENQFISKSSTKQITENKRINFLDMVPQKERNKVKRAIYDAIKFNSYNLNDVIIMNQKNNTNESCALSCIKTYSKINNEEFITITIFPNSKGVED